jgi:hypothetical protein
VYTILRVYPDTVLRGWLMRVERWLMREEK